MAWFTNWEYLSIHHKPFQITILKRTSQTFFLYHMTLWILLQTFCQWVHLYYHNPLPCCITSPVICQILKFYLLHHFSDFVTQVVENNLYSDLWINISQTNYRGQSSWMLKHELCDFSSYKHFNMTLWFSWFVKERFEFLMTSL